MTERGDEKSTSMGKTMTYDPTLSHSFSLHNGDNMEIIASYVLSNHGKLMDGDVTEETNYDHSLEMLDEPTDLQWLLKYMEYHYQKFGSHFEWEPTKRGGG